jgi:cyclase
MLKKRVAATLVVKDGIVVQSIGFKKYLPVGKPAIAIEFLNQWGIDEIILLDISATKENRCPDFKMIREATQKCHVPLAVGGGITCLNHIKELMHCGADKVALNNALVNNPDFVSEAAHVFGDQCIIASIDAIRLNNEFKVYSYVNGQPLQTTATELAVKAQELGAGEILINSVDRDGSYKGYDLELITSICDVSKVPVICCGGAKNADDFIKVFANSNVSAASAANFYHFTEHSVITTKALINKNVDVRLETFASYSGAEFNTEKRLTKKQDHVLEEMLFVRIEKEII